MVAAANAQLTELAGRTAALQHELGAARERCAAEEGVRLRLQEQLLATKASEAKLGRQLEAAEGGAARLEAQRGALEGELAALRRMLQDAEARCQASHRAAMEAAGEAKRLAPLEAKVARLEESLRGAGAELERAQREVGSQQEAVRRLLQDKATAAEQLAARSQALDATQSTIRELEAAAHDRLALAESRDKVGGCWEAVGAQAGAGLLPSTLPLSHSAVLRSHPCPLTDSWGKSLPR